MYLNYAKIKNEQKKQPMLRLRTLAGKELGPVAFAYDLLFSINYSDVSTIQFSVPYMVNGMLNPTYAALTSYKIVYTEEFGIYVLVSPTKSGDGVREVKSVTGYSLEYLFQKKNLFLEEGTYNFWNPADSKDTILGRIIELDPSWHIGYVAPRLIGCYRTFDEYDSEALSFCYSNAMEKYRCVFVFDVYKKSINVYDANESAATLPIYLNYKNLVDTVSVEELTSDLLTKLHVYGADGLTIRDVNPTGADYIVNLDYFLSNGDLDIRVSGGDMTLADKVRQWNLDIAEQQQYYIGLASSRASLTAQKLAVEAAITDLKGELESLVSQQSVTIQAFSLESTDAGRRSRQSQLDTINAQIAAKQGEIDAQQAKADSLQGEIEQYAGNIKSVVQRLSFSSYFTEEEQKALSPYLIEGSMEEETFVAADVDTSTADVISTVSGDIALSGSNLTRIDLAQFGRTMYTIAGGNLKIASASITAEAVRGTLDVRESSFVLSVYLGNTSYGQNTFDSGLLTINGAFSRFSSDISAHTEQGITEHKGTRLSIQTANSNSYFTVNVNDFQKYSVAMELYDFAVDMLEDYAWPACEFSISSGNFLYQEKFEPFKNKLELGKAVHLELGSEGRINAKIIGVEVDFEDISKFNLIFSNQYRLKNGTETWINEIKNVSRSSRSFNAGKYIYNRAAEQATRVSEFMSGSLDAATNTILGAANQSVVINGAGIHIGGDTKYQMRIVDSMIALTDDGWQTCKMGMGRFASPETGDYFGINADILAGTAHIGRYLHLENPQVDANNKPTGVMQFKVDSTGAWLNNSTFVLQKDGGGKILLDPKYGIVAGTGSLFDTDGTMVRPSFVDKNGMIVLDKDGMPVNSNFFLDLRDGSAYFRGNVYAEDGVFNGTVYATSGEFDGIIKARDFLLPSGESMKSVLNDKGKIDADWLDLYGINVKNQAGNTVLTIDENGLRFGTGYSPIMYQFSTSISGPWHSAMETNDKYRRESFDGGTTWGSPFQYRGTDGANGRPGSDASVTRANIVKAMLNSIQEDGLFVETVNGKQCLGINATAIRTGLLSSIDIYGGSYYDKYGVYRLTLFGDDTTTKRGLSLEDSRFGTTIFNVHDSSGGGVGFSTKSGPFLFNDSGNGMKFESAEKSYPQGTWDFSYADVQGVTAVFA